MSVVIDIFDFVRKQRQAQGEQPMARFTRLVSDLPRQAQGEAGLVHWQAEGVPGQHHGKPVLRLRVQGAPVVMCQRCLTPFVWPVDVDVLLQPVATEAELDDDDSQLDGEEDEVGEPDKILGSPRFDLLEQVEDELILSIPYAPRHEVCPDALAAGAGDEQDAPAAKRPSPFAVLAKLKK